MGAEELPISVGVDPGHEFSVSGMAEVEWHSSAGGEEIFHILARPSVLPVCSGFDIRLSKLPRFDSFWAENVSVDLCECIPLVVRSLHVEGVCCAAMIEARNRFCDWNVGVGSSLSLLDLIGLIRAVTGVRLVRPLSKWDRRDSVPSRGREGYVVLPKSGERVVDIVGRRVESIPSPWDSQGLPGEVGERGVDLLWLKIVVVKDRDGEIPLDLCQSSLSIPGIPGSRAIVRVVMGFNIRSLAPWVSVLGTLYVPRRGAWVLKFGCWGTISRVDPRGIVSGLGVLPTPVVLVGGGIPNRDCSPVKGTGRGRCANGCQVCADGCSSLLKAGDDIVGWEWHGSPVSSWDSPPLEKPQSLQVSVNLLSVYEHED